MRKDNKLSRNNYLYREPKFDGDIFFYQPDGGLINGWRYKKGQITHKISPGNEDSSLPVLTRSTDCYFESFSYAYNVCPEMMNTAEFGAWVGNNDEGYVLPEVTVNGCSWQYGIITLKICTEVDDGDDGYGYGNGGGGGVMPPGNTNPPAQTQTTYSATITGSTQIELLDNFYFTPTVTPAATIVNVKYEIGKNNLIFEKWTLQEGEQSNCSSMAITPGEWSVRAIITLADTIIISNTLSVDVLYPDVNAIKDNPTVISQTESVWQETKNFASAASVREYGFWIYLNTSSMAYEFGETVPGITNINYCQEISQLEMPTHSELKSYSPLMGGKYAVAWFHTHPPLTYCPDYSLPKQTEASQADLNAFPNFPGLLYDYVGESSSAGKLKFAGHDLNASAQITTFGPYRRPNY